MNEVSTAGPTATAVLQISDLAVDLGGRRVLTDVNLHLGAGQVLGLVGPNGAGKTTLLRTIVGLQRPSMGQVLVAGQPAAKHNRIGYVPQRHDFVWDFPITVAEAVMTGVHRSRNWCTRPNADHWREVARALNRVQLGDLADRPVGHLSGGQRQRVLIARALAGGGQLLLLDEPFTGLDLPTQDLLSELFTALAAHGTSLVITTHDIASALFTCDQLALIRGTVMAVDTPTRLAANPQIWAQTFAVGPDSALLRLLQAAR